MKGCAEFRSIKNSVSGGEGQGGCSCCKGGSDREKEGTPTPVFFCNCSFHEALSPLFLYVRIARSLQARFSDLRIPKDLRKQTRGEPRGAGGPLRLR